MRAGKQLSWELASCPNPSSLPMLTWGAAPGEAQPWDHRKGSIFYRLSLKKNVFVRCLWGKKQPLRDGTHLCEQTAQKNKILIPKPLEIMLLCGPQLHCGRHLADFYFTLHTHMAVTLLCKWHFWHLYRFCSFITCAVWTCKHPHGYWTCAVRHPLSKQVFIY